MLKLISSIGLALTLAELKQRIRRLVTQGMLGAIGAVILLVGLIFLLVALHLWISVLLNPIASAAIIGGTLLFVALIFFLVAKAKGGAAAPSRPAPAASRPQENLAGLADLLGSPALRNQALLVGGLALILGFMFGRRARGDGDDDED